MEEEGGNGEGDSEPNKVPKAWGEPVKDAKIVRPANHKGLDDHPPPGAMFY